jgi:hypothetical protein
MWARVEDQLWETLLFVVFRAQAYPGAMRLLRIFGCVALAAAGCGDGSSYQGPETLTCQWLAGPDNCWASTALAAATCLPPDADIGTFSADNATCSYATGESVRFTPALVLPLPSDPPWNFTVNDVAGAACLHYEDSGAVMKLVVNGQTVTVTGAGTGMTITCPDGSSAGTSNAINLLACPNLAGLPGSGYGFSDTSVSLSLIGTNTDALPVFSCRKEQAP